jgi:hypothetical protein
MVSCLDNPSDVGRVFSFETSVYFYQTTWHYISEDTSHHSHHGDNHKSNVLEESRVFFLAQICLHTAPYGELEDCQMYV